MSYAIETVNLTKKFRYPKTFSDLFLRPLDKPRAVKALDGVNLQVKKGELFALLGPNGAGKTTLIKILCSLIIPDKGSARVNGWNILEDGERAKASIGLVTGEERSFYWRQTGNENSLYIDRSWP